MARRSTTPNAPPATARIWRASPTGAPGCPNGRLPAPPHDASGHTWHHADQDLFALTKHGPAPFAPPGYQSDMPAFADKLTDQEIRDVLAYIKSTWPPEIQARQTAITEKSRRD